MSKVYDYVVVGAGMYGAVFARQMANAGKKVLVVDKRHHIGGNCYTEEREGINVHVYGAHILHTNDREVWEFLKQFCETNNYTNRVRVNFDGRIYSFPINMNTFNQLYGVRTPREAIDRVSAAKIPIEAPRNLEEWILSQVGKDIYEIFFKGYTEKQWGRPATELPPSIIKRLPIRFTYNDNYFNDRYQGIPMGGYAKLFEKMLSGVEVMKGVNYLEHRRHFDGRAHTVIYCGKLDEFFDYKYGALDWRSLRFDVETLGVNDYQGTAVINYTEASIPYTRILEHKHFEYTGLLPDSGVTVITREYPENWSRGKEAYYPVRDTGGSSRLYEKYLAEAKALRPNIYFKGRLAEYIYRDMCPTIRDAMNFAEELLVTRTARGKGSM